MNKKLFSVQLLDRSERMHIYLTLAENKAQAKEQVESYHNAVLEDRGVYICYEARELEYAGAIEKFPDTQENAAYYGVSLAALENVTLAFRENYD